MPRSKVLFEKGSSMSNIGQCEGVEEDVWDDRKLNDAYDKALKIANAEVAKRVAMSTNTQPEEQGERSKTKKDKHSSSSSSRTNIKEEWKPGMACRSVYEEDGQEYEAFVLRIINEKECIVKYLGYDNCEVVPTITLKASLGKKERQLQMQQASVGKTEDQPDLEWMDDSDQEPSAGSTVADRSFQGRKKSPKKKKSPKQSSFCEMSEMPFQLPNLSMMPNFSMMPNVGSLELPMPPPPPMAMPSQVDSEDQAVSSMLLSWYMSGYYTGLYQGMKRAKQGRRRV